MDGDQRLGALAIVCGALFLGGALLGGFHCDRQKQESFRTCVAAGRAPAECALATDKVTQ